MHKNYLLIFNLLLVLFLGEQETYAEKKWAPDFIVVGAMKSGTTALRRFLVQNPHIVMSHRNEVHFFDIRYDRGPDWYMEQFPPRPSKHHLIGEKSPYYMVHPQVPERIHSLYPKVKLIMILRNPSDRAYSQYHFNVRRGLEPLTFEEAIEAEPKRIAKGEKELKRNPQAESQDFRLYSYQKRGVYIEQINRWLKFFPREQILIITHEDLDSHPLEVMNEIFTFLGLPHCNDITINYEISNYSPMQPETRQRLQNYFYPYNQELYKFLGRDLGWD